MLRSMFDFVKNHLYYVWQLFAHWVPDEYLPLIGGTEMRRNQLLRVHSAWRKWAMIFSAIWLLIPCFLPPLKLLWLWATPIGMFFAIFVLPIHIGVVPTLMKLVLEDGVMLVCTKLPMSLIRPEIPVIKTVSTFQAGNGEPCRGCGKPDIPVIKDTDDIF